MKLTILGSGSPEAYDRRASSGYLIETGPHKILLDCGGGVMDNLLRIGLLPKDITHLFFSHLHSDHMMDYARLVHAAWDEGAAPLQVFGPAPIAEITRRYFGPEGALAFDLVARTELPQSQEVWVARGGTLPRPWPAPDVTEIDAGFAMDFDGFRIEAAMATHAEPFLTCLALAVEADGKRFVYSGDTGICDSVRNLCQDADFLLHWCYRLASDQSSEAMKSTTPNPVEIFEMASVAGVGRVGLTHFRKHMDRDFDPAVLEGDLARKLMACVVEDLDRFEI